MTLSIETISITSLSKMIFSITIKNATPNINNNINDTQHNSIEHRYAENRIYFSIMLSVIMLSVVMLNVVMLSVVVPLTFFSNFLPVQAEAGFEPLIS